MEIVATPGSGEGRAMTTARRLQKLLHRRGLAAEIRSFTDLGALGRWTRTAAPVPRAGPLARRQALSRGGGSS